MSDTPSRVFALALLLIAVWVTTYWLYEPGEPPVTFDPGRPAAAERLLSQPGAGASTTPPPRRLFDDADDPSKIGPPSELKPPPSAEASAQPPADPPVPEPSGPRLVAPEFFEYVVQQGDRSFEDIAQKVYGDRKLWQAISRANPLVTPDRLIPGRTRLNIARDPTNIQGRVEPGGGGAPAKPAPEASAEVEYTIQKDDTLWSIAKQFYGRGAQWRVIADANRDVLPDPDKPVAGTKIRIPPPPPEPRPD